MRLSATIAVLSLALLGLTGCKSACRELSEKVCDCSTNSVQRELCIRRAANDEARVEPTVEEEAVCEGLVDQCDCAALQPDQANTDDDGEAATEAKISCGLAHAPAP
jgi:hypothetical protein